MKCMIIMTMEPIQYFRYLKCCRVWRPKTVPLPAPDGAADVDLLSIDEAAGVQPPVCAVHQMALGVPVKPLHVSSICKKQNISHLLPYLSPGSLPSS